MIRVMVVDDHPQMLGLLGKVLTAAPDIDVVALCPNGQSALDAVAATTPEVILMDLVMPGINGLDATRQITAHYPEIRVWIHTATAHPHLPDQAHAAGAVGVLPKRGDIRALLAAIRAPHEAPA